MLKLLKNGSIYDPNFLGKKDLLIAGNKIIAIEESISINTNIEIEIIDLKNKIIIPGLIDSHVHITGGGGEGGCRSRTPEILLTELTKSGITTVVGCLGTDSVTRTMSNLVAKSYGLREEGVSCFCYTGSYQIPVKTLTESIQNDLLFIDPIIGVGEIAISDHRSTQPTFEELAKTIADSHVGGMLSGKGGLVNVHVGESESGLELLEEVINNTDLPITQILPTHVNRNFQLFDSSFEYAEKGGNIDLTTAISKDDPNAKTIKCSRGLKRLLEENISIERISFSSDAQGSLPVFDDEGVLTDLKVGRIESLFNETRDSIKKEELPMETVLKVVTENPARNLKLKNKGSVKVGKDADLIVLDQDLNIESVFAMGETMVLNNEIIRKGTFE